MYHSVIIVQSECIYSELLAATKSCVNKFSHIYRAKDVSENGRARGFEKVFKLSVENFSQSASNERLLCTK